MPRKLPPNAPPGWIPASPPDGTKSTHHVLESMKRDGLTIDRENYLWRAYGADWEGEWGPELEAELPEELRDWETPFGKGN